MLPSHAKIVGTRMTDAAIETEEAEVPAKKSGGKLPLVLGIVGALVLSGAGFYVVYSGLLGPSIGGADKAKSPEAKIKSVLAEVTFVPIEQIIVTLPPEASARNLRFLGQLEVAPGQAEAVQKMMPRIVDVLNTYLRAVDVKDLQEPSSAARLRAQMLRRVQVVAGEGVVKDLLITEFVLN